MPQEHTLKIVARMRSDFADKFGSPRQSGLVPALEARVVFEPEYRDPEALRGAGKGLIVTPKDIDARTADMAKVIGFGVNLALQTGLTAEEVEMLLS